MKGINKQQGSATIEATISLTCFIFLIMAIYSIVNLCVIQARMANAINTTAKEMSQYSYFYHVFALDSLDAKLKEKKQMAVGTFETVNEAISSSSAEISKINEDPMNYFEGTLTGDITSGEEAYAKIQDAQAKIKDVINNPQEFIKSMAALGGEGLLNEFKSHVVAAPIAKGLTQRHFGKNLEEANEYLKSRGVVGGYDGVNFNMSSIFDKDSPKDIKIVVVYNIDLSSMFPFDMKITMCQSAVVKGWLGGDLK